jgi:hypothetical protein
MMNNPSIHPDTLTFLLQHELQQALVSWQRRSPARTGLHAYSLLDSEQEWCLRQHVLAEHFPDQREPEQSFWHSAAYLAHGWSIHEKWQHKLLKPTGLVTHYSTGDYELDRTHIDQDRGIHFSPDAILSYAGINIPLEIKGINHDDYAGHEAYYDASGNLIAEAKEGIAGKTLQEAAKLNKSIHTAIPQLNLYLHLLELPIGIILVEDKNTQDFTLFPWEYNKEMAQPLARRASEVKARNVIYKDHGRLPKRICKSASDPRAKRCPFSGVCFSREE